MSSIPPAPPRVWETLLGLCLPWRYEDEHLGDLSEGFAARARIDPRGARRWYRRQVLRSLPGALRLRWQSRHDSTIDSGPRMDTLLQDVRFGLRALWKSPGFAVVATLTLAVAIGVNASIFSLVNAIVFADLPMQDSEDVVLIRGTNAELGIDQGSVSPADYLALEERSRSFESIVATTETQWVLTGGDQPLRVQGLQTSAALSESWRLPPVLGRAFAEGEDQSGAPPVAMLTHAFWTTQYGARPSVLGETLRLDGTEYTIVGVSDPRLEFADFANAQVITPLVLNRSEPNRTVRYLFVSGRLAPGVSAAAAEAEVRGIGEQLAAEFPTENTGWGLWAAPVMESLIDEDGNTILLLLQLTVGMVILLACANVANMLLARATARGREIAVRAAIGAARGRLVRQLLTESLMISLMAAALGLGFAYTLNRALIWISAGTEQVFLMADFDARVLVFTLMVSLVAPIAFGLFPALRASGSGPQDALRDGRSGDGGRSGKRARSVLATAQISLAMALMIVAGLITRSVVNIQSRPLGFDPADLMTVRIALPESGYETDEERRLFFEQAQTAIAAAMGTDAVEMTNAIPGSEFGARRSLVIEGLELPEGRAAPNALMVTVSPGFFDLLDLEVQSGRAFTREDRAESFRVAVLSRAIADRYWPDEDPIGRRFQVAGQEEWTQVVGVVADVIAPSETESGAPSIYLPFAQDSRASMALIGRTSIDAAALAGPLRQAVWSVDANQPVDRLRTLERARYEATATNFALTTLFATFAVFALFMSAIGIYGVMAYSVAQRKNEIGLRMALGAERGQVRAMILLQGTRILAVGVGIGLVVSYGLSRMLSNLVFGITPTDPLTFIGVPTILILVALTANLIPALRATRLDPALTLRAD